MIRMLFCCCATTVTSNRLDKMRTKVLENMPGGLATSKVLNIIVFEFFEACLNSDK